MGSSPLGPRREWGVNVQIGAAHGGGESPGLHKPKARKVGDAAMRTKRGVAETARPLHRGGQRPLPSSDQCLISK